MRRRDIRAERRAHDEARWASSDTDQPLVSTWWTCPTCKYSARGGPPKGCQDCPLITGGEIADDYDQRQMLQ